jgi:hypothetical protein
LSATAATSSAWSGRRRSRLVPSSRVVSDQRHLLRAEPVG